MSEAIKIWQPRYRDNSCLVARFRIPCGGRVEKATNDEDDFNETHINEHKAIGNYFETKKEAERAVKKLKAWKRLKEKGFEFEGWNCALRELSFEVPDTFFPRGGMINMETKKDLDLLFERGEYE